VEEEGVKHINVHKHITHKKHIHTH